MTGGDIVGAFKKIEGRKVYVDFTFIVAEKDSYERTMRENMRKIHARNKALKLLFPYQHLLGKRRIVETPEEMQELCDKYFESCNGPLRDKWGNAVTDKEGHAIIVQIKPYTISGLAAAIGMSTTTLKNYTYKSLAGTVHPEFSNVIMRARQKIEQYSEEQLFNREGVTGAEFMLRAGFRWSTKQEETEMARNLATIKKMQQDYELQKRQLKIKERLIEGEDVGDNQVVINIVRAKPKSKSSEVIVDDE